MTDSEVLGGMDPFRIAVAEAPDTTAALLPTDAADRLTERIRRLRGSAPKVEMVPQADVSLDRLDPATISESGAHAVVLSLSSELDGTSADEFAAAADRLISAVRTGDGPHLVWFTASTVDPEGGDAYRVRPEPLRPASASTRCRTGPAVEDPGNSPRRRRPDRGRAGRRRPCRRTAPLLAGRIRGACRGNGPSPRRHRLLRAASPGGPDRRSVRLRCATT